MSILVGVVYSDSRAVIDRGTGYVSGGPETVPVSGVLYGTQALSRRVTLYHQRSMRVVDEQQSGADGFFLFERLAPEHYVAIAWDVAEDGTRKRAGIQDFIWPAFD